MHSRQTSKAGKPPYNAPAEIHPIMERGAIKAGDRAPQFILKDEEGVEHSSRELLEQGPLVVTFYRGVWCPYCNFELQALNAVLPELRRHRASLVAISPQTAVNSRKSIRTTTSPPPSACASRCRITWSTCTSS
jgi:peroxiredoxin